LFYEDVFESYTYLFIYYFEGLGIKLKFLFFNFVFNFRYPLKINKMKIAIGGDHAGFEYKKTIISTLENKYEIKDFGSFSDESTDYPDYVHPLSSAVEAGEYDLGIVICGSGNGVAITANKHQQIRCALCWNTELAALARQHNNANVLAIPARFISLEEAQEIIKTFLETEFEGGRHSRRIDKIACV
jgi:ribose 5-phosphate isomerase B